MIPEPAAVKDDGGVALRFQPFGDDLPDDAVDQHVANRQPREQVRHLLQKVRPGALLVAQPQLVGDLALEAFQRGDALLDQRNVLLQQR